MLSSREILGEKRSAQRAPQARDAHTRSSPAPPARSPHCSADPRGSRPVPRGRSLRFSPVSPAPSGASGFLPSSMVAGGGGPHPPSRRRRRPAPPASPPPSSAAAAGSQAAAARNCRAAAGPPVARGTRPRPPPERACALRAGRGTERRAFPRTRVRGRPGENRAAVFSRRTAGSSAILKCSAPLSESRIIARGRPDLAFFFCKLSGCCIKTTRFRPEWQKGVALLCYERKENRAASRASLSAVRTPRTPAMLK